MGILGLGKKRIQRGNLPPQGRSSAEPSLNIAGALGLLDSHYGELNLYRTLHTLERLATYNPDVSHAIRNWINMANTGHQILIDGGSDAENGRVLDELNRLAATLYDGSYGIDGLVNHYLRQIAVTGAVSSEDILEGNLSGVHKVELVPVHQVRFIYADGAWRPQQWANGKRYDLNDYTYRYFAHSRMREDRPYAMPLIIAVLEPIARQKNMHENIDYLMKKFGLLGFIDMVVKAPARKQMEDDNAYQSRLRSYLDDVARATGENYRNGVLVHFDDQTVRYESMNAIAAGGARGIHQLNEEQVFSGIGIDPAMQGRSFSTTETYAGVVYNLAANEARTLQRMVKRRLEATYRLHLLLTGRDVDVRVVFNKVADKDPKAAAEREQIEIANVMTKVKAGLISPDQGAQELGYDEWENPALAVAQYDPTNNTYGGLRHPFDGARRLSYHAARSLAAGDDNPEGDDADWSALTADYLRRLRPHLTAAEQQAVDEIIAWMGGQSDDPGQDAFVAQAYGIIRDSLTAAGSSDAVAGEITTAVTSCYEAARFAGDAIKYGKTDVRLVTLGSATDRMYVSSYVRNTDYMQRANGWLAQAYRDNGNNLFGRAGSETIEAFRAALGNQLQELSDMQVRRIIDTSVQTMRNWGQVQRMEQIGVEKLEVYEPMGEFACGLCAEMHGKVVETRTAREYVDKVSGMTADRYAQHLRERSEMLNNRTTLRGTSMQDAVAGGYGTPPYHPHCKGRLIKHREVYGTVDGQKVNVAERGKQIRFADPATQKTMSQTIAYTVVDSRGQKVYVTNEGLGHAARHGVNNKIAGMIREGEYYESVDQPGVFLHVNAGRALVTHQHGDVISWTAFEIDNPKRYLKNYIRRGGKG